MSVIKLSRIETNLNIYFPSVLCLIIEDYSREYTFIKEFKKVYSERSTRVMYTNLNSYNSLWFKGGLRCHIWKGDFLYRINIINKRTEYRQVSCICEPIIGRKPPYYREYTKSNNDEWKWYSFFEL